MLPLLKIFYRKSTCRLLSGLIILYLGIPLLGLLENLPVPLMLVLIVMGLLVYLYMRFDPSFDRIYFTNWQSGKKEIRSMILMFIPAAMGMTALIWVIDSEKLFLLLRANPLLLLMICIFYPLFSVVPQGLVYRALFFHRYGLLFPGRVYRIMASALLFSFGHILYKSWLVLLLTFVAGLLFAWRYERSRSLLVSILEHAVYGVWLFACGLGYFFVSSMVD
jgi:membrane protease YdiL (CAAX protease family)